MTQEELEFKRLVRWLAIVVVLTIVAAIFWWVPVANHNDLW